LQSGVDSALTQRADAKEKLLGSISVMSNSDALMICFMNMPPLKTYYDIMKIECQSSGRGLDETYKKYLYLLVAAPSVQQCEPGTAASVAMD
jgi:hypothetical protein